MENHEEIALALYQTPPASSDDEEVDPMWELEAMEREEDERRRLAMEVQDTPTAPPPVKVATPCSEDAAWPDPGGVGAELEAHPGDSTPMEIDAASEEIPSVTDSEDASTTVTPSPDITLDDTDQGRESDVAITDNEEEAKTEADDADTDDGFEVVWSGHTPQWACHAGADEANALLVHACSCDARCRCRDPQFGALCLPMKRLLRRACWASHNNKWLAGDVAAQVAKLLGYHSLHCDVAADRSTGVCVVPLCAELSRV